MLTREEIKNILEVYFKEIADVYGIETAFLYGSWARGYPKKSSDVDIAVVLAEMSDEDEVFKRICLD